MTQPYYKVFREVNELGIRLAYNTVPGGYRPLHWHEAIEILFPLNGDADITIEGKKYRLLERQLIVINSSKVHSTFSYTKTHMFVCIQISTKLIQKYMADIDLYQIHCVPEEITDEQMPHYQKLCQMVENLTRLYIEDAPAYMLESEGIILQMLAHILRYFSVSAAPRSDSANMLTMERLREIITYVDEHYKEPITLQEVADLLGIGKEYFCRFFKKNMGMSFLNYLNEVRVSHIYQDIQNSDAPIAEIIEANGFSNQKLFNKTFKELYGCTPSAVRKNVI